MIQVQDFKDMLSRRDVDLVDKAIEQMKTRITQLVRFYLLFLLRVPTAHFEDAGRPRVALVSRGGVPLAELELGPQVTFVLGAEREGLPDELLRDADALATIPQAEHADSLNVAAAGAIALYEATRGAK